tara:strand:- start:105 stop:1061 length:957 start_codon:yes stop_codon:yes gene_type:complete
MKIKTIIIGLGSAGAFDCFIDKTIPFKRNHLDSIKNIKQFDIVGLIDSDKNKQEKIIKENKFDSSIFFDSLKNFKIKNLDLVIVATPTQYHYETIKKSLTYKPRLIICEKPLSNSIKESEEIINILEKSKTKLILNYQRQFDSMFTSLENFLIKKEFNTFICKYNRGFFNNASHMIFFFYNLFGKIQNFKISKKKKIKNDYSIDVKINFRNGKTLQIISFDKGNFDIFDIECYSHNSKIEFFNGGITFKYSLTKANEIFNNYSHLKVKKLKFSKYGDGFENLYKRVICYFKNRDKFNEISLSKYNYFYKQLNRIILSE